MFMNPGNRAFPRVWARDGMDGIIRIDNIERMRVNSIGCVGIGSDAGRILAFDPKPIGTRSRLIIADDPSVAGLITLLGLGANSSGITISFCKTRGTTPGSTTILSTSDTIGQIKFMGTDGTAFRDAAIISAGLDGAPAGGSMPGGMTFWTTPSGTTSVIPRMAINNGGNVMIGGTSDYFGTRLAVNGTNAAGSSTTNAVYSNDTSSAQRVFIKSRNATIGSHTVVQNNDFLGQIIFRGDDGTNYIAAAEIRGDVDGTPGTNDMPGRLVFSTTADGASSVTEWLRINAAGRIATQGVTDSMQYSQSFAWLHLPGTNNDNSGVGHSRFSADAGGPTINLGKSRNATRNSHTIVQSGDVLGGVYFDGSDGSAFRNAAAITGNCDGTPGASDMPGSLKFFTTADGSATGTERMRINNGGRLWINANNAFDPTFSYLQIENISTGGTTSIQSEQFSNDTFAFTLTAAKARSTGMAIVQSGDNLGQIQFRGSDGANFQKAALIIASCDGTPGTNDMPGRLEFHTTPDGSTSPAERMRIDNAGRVNIGNNGAIIASSFSNNPLLQVTSFTTGNIPNVAMHKYTADLYAPMLSFFKSRGTTAGSFTAVASGDFIGVINCTATDGTSIQECASIAMVVDGAVSAGTVPTYMIFRTAASGGGTERMRINKDGLVNIGNQGANIAGGLGANVMLQISTTSTQEAISIHRYTTDTSAPFMGFIKSRGTTVGSVTAVASGDRLGYIGFAGTDGTGVIDAGNIQVLVDGTVSTNVMPTRISFQTCQTNTQVERWRMDNLGILISGSGASSTASVFGDICILQVNNKSDETRGSAALKCWTNDVNSPNFFLEKSRGTSIGSFTAVQANDHLGGIIFGGADGTAFKHSALIDVRVDGTVASNSVPARMSFGCTAVSATGTTEALRINNTGAIYAPLLSTTASAANCFINNASSPANEIQRVTSSLRYKKDVEPVDMEIAKRVLDEARPIWFRSKIAGDNNKSFYGFGAEEMAEIDPRLVSWSYLKEDVILRGGDEWSIRAGAQLVPEAVMYDRVSLLQIVALKEQVKELQDQISALTKPKRRGR